MRFARHHRLTPHLLSAPALPGASGAEVGWLHGDDPRKRACVARGSTAAAARQLCYCCRLLVEQAFTSWAHASLHAHSGWRRTRPCAPSW